jgi:hypothetical protein
MITASKPYDDSMYNSRLSFRLLIETLKKNLSAGNPGSQKLYGELLNKVESYPELLQPITDVAVLDTHKELVEMLLAAIFPLTHSENENLFAVSIPFKYQTIYSSTLFKQLFQKSGSNEISLPDMQVGCELDAKKMAFAYNYDPEKILCLPGGAFFTDRLSLCRSFFRPYEIHGSEN